MNRAALEKFNGQRVAKQNELFGVVAIYLGQSITVCHSAVRSRKELTDGGFLEDHDFVCRISKKELSEAPAREGSISVGGVTYRIAEVIAHPISGEWVLGLRERA